MRVRLVTLAVLSALACALWATGARADASAPPITTPPPAGSTPPPAEGLPNCGDVSGWYLQSAYADVWSSESTWWEAFCPPVGAFPTGGYVVYPTSLHYWDGARAVHYGTWEEHADYDNGYFACFWSDVAAGQWYGPFVWAFGCSSGDPAPPPNAYPTASFTFACSADTCSFDASASSDSDGAIQSFYWNFGDGSGFVEGGVTTTHTYPRSGSYSVTLEVADDDGAWASTSAIVTVELPNTAPEAEFVWSCSGLSCSFDGIGSTDSDGAIANWTWSFGDGASAGGELAQHAYAQPGTYLVTLTVTDDAGATATVTDVVLTIRLTASAYKERGLRKVDLTWNGPGGTSFDLYRAGSQIATLQATSYMDVLAKGAGSQTYKVCAVDAATCSNETTISF